MNKTTHLDRCCNRKGVKDSRMVETDPDGTERILEMTPGYICQKTGGSSHGKHGMNLRFVYRKDGKAVQFLMFAMDWMPGAGTRYGSQERLSGVMAADLGFHSPTPRYDGHESMGPCEYLGGEPCYYDRSGLNAEPVLESFFIGGLPEVWGQLREYYDNVFATEADQ